MPKISSSPALVQPVKVTTQPVATPVAAPVAQQSGGWQPKPAASTQHNGGGIGGFFKKIGDELANGAAKSVGYLEMAGLRYPVSHYSAKVSDTLTRGSRISDGAKGYQSLHDQGFKSIVDLTAEGTDNTDQALKAGLHTMQVPTIDNSPPTIAQMREMLGFIQAPENQPAYIHCEAGVGRTGVAAACYRMAVQGWTAEQATAEAQKFGLHLPSQLDFIKQFSAALDAGQMPEFRKPTS